MLFLIGCVALAAGCGWAATKAQNADHWGLSAALLAAAFFLIVAGLEQPL